MAERLSATPVKTPVFSGKRVLIRPPNWLGDGVMALPAIQKVAREAASITFLAHARVAALYTALGEVHPFHNRKELLQTALALHRIRPEVGLVFPESFSSGLAMALTGAPVRVGFSSPAGLWHTHLVRHRGKAEHKALDYLRLVDPSPSLPRAIAFPFTPEERENVERILERWGLPSRYVVMAPFVAYGPAKAWPLRRVAALLQKLSRILPVVLVGSPAERRKAEVFEGMAGVINLVGRPPLRQVAILLSRASVVIGNDSGITHLAAATGAPTLALFFSTDPRWSRPLGERVRVLYRPLFCSPCHKRLCPLSTYACLETWTPEEVLQETLNLLD